MAIINILKKSRLPALTGLVTTLSILFSSAAVALELTRVADGIYVHQGQHRGIDEPGRDDIANIGFIVGEKCVAVIDTGGSIAIATQLQQEISALTDKPVCYVINTHVHFDHVLGNAVFKNDNTRFVGHINLPDALTANVDFFLEEFKAELGNAANPELIVKPGLLVEDLLEIDLGNRVLELRAYPPAHTNTDLSIFDKQTGSLWLSDLLFVERIPVLDGSLKGWLEVLEEIASMEVSYVIPGHGPGSDSLADALQPQQQYLTAILDEIRVMLARGAFMEEVIDEVAASEASKWKLHEHQHKRNVSKAFIELEWE